MSLSKHRGSVAAFLILLAAPALAQTTVTVPCAADNTLYQSVTGDLSNGAGPGLFVGVNGNGAARRAVLRFDVAANVPANARIVSASLNLNCAQSTIFLPFVCTGHRLLASWGEGTSVAAFGGGGGGAPATTNDATWLHRFYPATAWANAGGDYAAAPSFTIAIPNTGPCSSVPSPQATADVQAWLTSPTQNFGWLVRSDELVASTAHRIDSRESTTGVKPTLTVSYLLPGQNGSWGTGCPVGGNNFTTAWVGAPVGGTTVSIAKSFAPPSSVGADFFTLDLDPFGTPLLPGCTVYLPLAQVIPGSAFLTNGAGAGSTNFAVPAGFPGYLIVCQAAVLDTSPLGFQVSNAALTCLQ